MLSQRMKVRIHAPPNEVLDRIRAITAKRSIFNFSFGERPLFHGEVNERSFNIEWLPRQGVLWGPSLAGTITSADGDTTVDVRLRPTFRIVFASIPLFIVFPLAVGVLLTGWVLPGLVGIFMCCAMVGMNVYVAKMGLSALRRQLAELPGAG